MRHILALLALVAIVAMGTSTVAARPDSGAPRGSDPVTESPPAAPPADASD
jgi:hypothetical protein